MLYFDGCPSHEPTGEALREALAEEGIEARVAAVAVNTDEDARRLRFPGSPTIRLNGEDLFPARKPENWGLRCRVYATPEGLKGSPTREMLWEAPGRTGDAGAHGPDGRSPES